MFLTAFDTAGFKGQNQLKSCEKYEYETPKSMYFHEKHINAINFK